MTERQRGNSSERLYDGGAGKSSYLGEKGESVFIRTSGKGDFQVFNLISREDFALVDVFFTSEEEARLFADNRNLRIAVFDDNATSASGSQARSSKGTTPD
jgi:hypothetical protein